VLARAVALAREHPKDSAALEALTWIIAGGIGSGRETDAAFDLLSANHSQSEQIEHVCSMAAQYQGEVADRFLQKVLEKNPARSVRGVACLSLARRRKDAAEAAQSRKPPESNRLGREAERFYERVLADYADVVSRDRKLGDQARKALFEMHHLVVGKVAPEIVGEDLDGRRFKLSDYRGKVVMLDFWGDW
jgi:hypothetical protein